jgi:hypothetical protein
VVLKDSSDTELSSYIKNLDVLLSSRASEATLLDIKAKLDRFTFDDNNRLAIQDLPNLDVPLSTRASETTLQNLNQEIANNLWQRIRYGRILTAIEWVYGSIFTAPAANTTLVSYTVPPTKQAYIYGYYISGSAAMQFLLRWTSNATLRTLRIILGAGGTLHNIYLIPINEGLPADPNTAITIVNVSAGASGSVYQAGLLIAIL